MIRDLIRRLGRASALATLIAVLAVGAAVGAAVSSDRGDRRAGNVADPGPERSAPTRVIQAAERVVTQRGPRGRAGERGPRGKRGRRGKPGPPGPAGPAGSSAERVLQLGVDWDGSANASPDSDSVELPGIGTLTVACPTADPLNFTDGPRRLYLSFGAGEGRRTVANLTILQQGSDFPDSVENQRLETTGSPIALQLPNNGMVVGTFSAETVNGNGAAAGTLPAGEITLSSSWKTNDPNPDANFCHLSGQVLTTGAP